MTTTPQNSTRTFSWMTWYEAQTDNAIFDAMRLKERAAKLRKRT